MPIPALSRLLRAIVAAVLCSCAALAHAKLVVMHGYADYTSAILWLQTDRPAAVVIDVAPESGGAATHYAIDTSAENDATASFRVPGLTPGTRYHYRIAAEGDVREGTLATQRYPRRAAEAPELVIAFGSCNKIANPDPRFRGAGGDYQIFDAIAAKQPDVMLWLGDNIYLDAPDFTDPGSMAAHYRRERAFAPLQKLLTSTAHLAIWDDHDFGPNDVGGSYVFKGETLKLFKRYWPNPSFGLPEVPGIFGWVRLADVEIFMLDDRYYRYPKRYPDVPEKTMFGAAQFEWLRQALLYSTARVKIVANGSQLWSRPGPGEGLADFPQEQKRLAEWLVQQKIDGVVFLSGDRHFGELLRVERAGAPPLYEFTSSPLTYAPRANLSPSERDDPNVVPGTVQLKRQFGIVRVSGPGTARHVAFESYDSDGAPLWKHDVVLQDLQFPRTKP
jgi:alkaline phosphatase D